MIKTKKGQLSSLQDNAIAFVVVGIALAIGLTIMAGIRTDLTPENMSEATSAQNASLDAITDSISGMGALSGFLPTIGLVIAAVVVLSYVFLLRQ